MPHDRRQLGRTGGRKRQMTDSEIKAAKKLLASGYQLEMWLATWDFRCLPYIDGYQPQP